MRPKSKSNGVAVIGRLKFHHLNGGGIGREHVGSWDWWLDKLSAAHYSTPCYQDYINVVAFLPFCFSSLYHYHIIALLFICLCNDRDDCMCMLCYKGLNFLFVEILFIYQISFPYRSLWIKMICFPTHMTWIDYLLTHCRKKFFTIYHLKLK